MRFFFILFLVSSTSAWAQNLLPNGDFEERIICEEFTLPCGPMGWKLTTGESPRYLCNYVVYKNKQGVTERKYTAKWPSIVVKGFTGGNEREYLEAPILCPLVKGKAYRFSMDVRPEESAISELGVLFVHDYIYTRGNYILYLKPQVECKNKEYLTERKNRWLRLSYTYVANGRERYILIGNFLDDTQTRLKGRRWIKKTEVINYDIDNVSLSPVKPCKICDFSIYLDSIRADRKRHTPNLARLFPEIPEAVKISDQSVPPVFFHQKPELISTKIIYGKDTFVEGRAVVLKNIYFDVDKYILLPRSFPELDTLVQLMTDHPGLNIEIQGHTDITGKEAHNMELSVNRAKAVARYLESRGIETHRVVCHGFASTRPVSTNDTPEGRQKNRRVEFVLSGN